MVKKTSKRPDGPGFRNLYANDAACGSIVFNRTVAGVKHQFSTGTHDWKEAARERDAYERKNGIADVPAGVQQRKQRSSAPRPKRPPAATPARIDDQTVQSLLEKLRTRRDALRTEIAGVEKALAAVESAAEILGRPAA